jgi:hypothetical protein
MVEDKKKRIPFKGWTKMIRKVREVNPILSPKGIGVLKVVSFVTYYQAVDRIIDYLKLTIATNFKFLISIPSWVYFYILKGNTDSRLNGAGKMSR